MEFSRDTGMMMENKRNVCSLGESSIKRHKSDLSFNSKVLLYLDFMDLLAKVLFGLKFNRPKSAVFANQHGNDPPSLFS